MSHFDGWIKANLGIFAQRPQKVYSGENGSPRHAELY